MGNEQHRSCMTTGLKLCGAFVTMFTLKRSRKYAHAESVHPCCPQLTVANMEAEDWVAQRNLQALGNCDGFEELGLFLFFIYVSNLFTLCPPPQSC